MIPPCLCRNLSASLSADRQAKDRQAADRNEQPEIGFLSQECTAMMAGRSLVAVAHTCYTERVTEVVL